MKTTARKIAGLLVLLTAGACEASVDPPVEEAPTPGAPGTTLPRGSDEGGAPTQGPAPASAFSCTPARPGKVGDATLKVKVGDKERTAFVHVPKSYDATKGTTLVLGFHGYGGSAEQMRSQTSLDAASDKHGFIVAYAQGTGVSKGFNGGDCCGGAAWNDGADDLAFGRELVKAISKDFCVDPKRVHSAGFSNGGFMSYRFACEASDLFASVASVSGVLGTEPEK
ncbi:MAG: prolyl oligopeptidase family serine peptidase, partial [Myxococcales bacterium]|nr:prolyl oligopeptidase family serine peptidase [Myxococcales bacterium]